MDTNSFIVYIKADDIYKSNGKDDETRFHTSNYELNSTLPKGKNKKVFGLMKDESDEKIERKFVALRANSYSYLKDGGSEDKKAKQAQKSASEKAKLNLKNTKTIYKHLNLRIKQITQKKIKFTQVVLKNHKQSIRNNKSNLTTQERFKSERHNIFTEEIHKIVGSSNDDERMQSIHSIETYAYKTSKDLVSKKEVIKCNNIINDSKMINFDDVVKEKKR